MKTNLFTLLALFCLCTVTAQSLPTVERGVITLISGEETAFVNLRFINNNDMIVYRDVVAAAEKACKLADVYQIQDSNQKEIYKNAQAAPSRRLSTQAPNASLENFIANVPEKKDTLFVNTYPNGIYVTKEEFINKKPSLKEALMQVTVEGHNLADKNTKNCFFLKTNDRKLKKVFAVCYKGQLFFQINAILKHRNKTDRSQDNDHPNSFVKVISGGDNYLYMETDLANVWAKGVAYGLGGYAGYTAAKSLESIKGVVWDFKNEEFNIFKNCRDYNAFIEPIYTEGVQECENQQTDIILVRQAIEKIK